MNALSLNFALCWDFVKCVSPKPSILKVTSKSFFNVESKSPACPFIVLKKHTHGGNTRVVSLSALITLS